MKSLVVDACILTGSSDHGFKLAPPSGERLAAMLAGRLSAGDFTPWVSGDWISGRSGAMQGAATPK